MPNERRGLIAAASAGAALAPLCVASLALAQPAPPRLPAAPSEERAAVAQRAGSAQAAPPAQAGGAARGDTASGVATLDAFLERVRSLSADFKQELYSADQRLLETETGTFALERPNRFRWRYAEPTELIVVADGSDLWMYDVDLSQVTVAPLDDTVGSSPALLLSGASTVRDGFDVVQTYSLDGLDWVKLEPKADSSDFSSVLIGFADTVPQRLELVDGLNQVTRIEFANVVVNPELPPATFEFAPPQGVDVIGKQG